MRGCGISLLAIVTVGSALTVGRAAEPYRAFLDGLRQRGYRDTALEYLEQLEQDPALPEDFRVILPYEKATTLMALARELPTPEMQNREFNRAQALLEQFARENPSHPLAGPANSQRARILLSKAKVEIWQAQAPSNEGNRSEFQQRARELIGEARKVFQQAHDQFLIRWESFPKFIDQEKEPERYKERMEAELGYLLAQFDLAKCTYEAAQTYDKGSKEYQETLITASKEFEELHSKYRLLEIGLVARAWQGKCFEEQDDIRRAIGIYNELLSHPGDAPAIKRLQDQVRQFRLICLNHEKRKDYKLVIQESDEWMAKNRGMTARSEVGLGIRWEQAVAQEKLADLRETPSDERDRLLRAALANLREINRYAGQYKDLSMFMIRRLTVKLRGKEAGDPQDFDTAFGLAREMVNKVGELNDAVAQAANKEARKELEAERTAHLSETARYLNLALQLADSKTDVKDLNLSRVLLSFIYYQMRESYRAAILGEFVARHYGDASPKEAQDGAYFAMAAYVQAYNQAREQDKDVDLAHILRVCNLITEKWPNSDRANDAMMNMGSVLNTQRRPLEAAGWFERIPESATSYSQAQFSAGQAYWTAYATWSAQPEEERATREERQTWLEKAEQHLRTGITKSEAEHPASEASPPTLIAGKVSLAEILLEKGDYEAAIKLIQTDPHAVTTAITVPDEAKRPKEGVQSRAFASAVYQSLLRGFVGTQQLEKARETMQQLESVTESGGGEAVTEIYKDLGKKLQDELERLRESGNETRLQEVRGSFEKFLSDMYARKDQTYGSLIWIAETYFGLGEGTSDNVAQSSDYFTRAAETFQTILDRSAGNEGFQLDESHVTAVKLRLATCRRRQGQFEDALKLASEIIAAAPNTLSAQIEAARIYQDWAAMGQADAARYFQVAIAGTQVNGAEIWGWGTTGQKLQRLMATSGTEARDRYQQEYFDARYNAAWCRYQSGLEASGEDRTRTLTKAKVEIQTFASITTGVDKIWWDKFDKLYQEIQEELGESPVVALERPMDYQPADTAVKTDSQGTVAVDTRTQAAVPQGTAQADVSGGGWGMLIFAIVLFGCGGFGIYMMVAKSGKRRRPSYAMASNARFPVAGATKTRSSTARSAEAKSAAGGPDPAKRRVAVRKPPAEGPAAKPKVPAPPEEGAAAAQKKRPRPQPKPGDAPTGSPPPAAPKRRPPKPE